MDTATRKKWQDLVADLRAQLQQAQEEARVMQLIGIRARRNEKQAQSERDEAITQAEAVEGLAHRLVARLNTVNSTAEQAKQLVGLIQDEVQDCLRGSAPAEA